MQIDGAVAKQDVQIKLIFFSHVSVDRLKPIELYKSNSYKSILHRREKRFLCFHNIGFGGAQRRICMICNRKTDEMHDLFTFTRAVQLSRPTARRQCLFE